MRDAVRTLLVCIGEDPLRDGLLKTPERYAKALLFLSEGYQESIMDIVGDAILTRGTMSSLSSRTLTYLLYANIISFRSLGK